MTVDINQVATVMSELQTNYSALATSWYDIFYNSTPQDITLQMYDDAGVLTTYTLPNRAKDFTYIKNGLGTPEGTAIGSVGSLYQDLTNGELYIKVLGTGNTGWVLMVTKSDLDAIILERGSGTPEGALVGTVGALYVDTLTGDLYIKRTGSGNTGWYLNAGVETKTTIETKLGVSSTNISFLSSLTYTPADDSNTVHLTGTETITGTKTFDIANFNKVSVGTLSYTAANNVISAQSSAAQYVQLIMQNTSNNSGASTDIVVNNDISTDSTNYGSFGMNSSTFTGSGAFNQANNVYLWAQNADLAIGTGTSNAIHFLVNNGATDALTIDTSGNTTASGIVKSTQFKLSALNTAPASASATGTIGDIRIVDGYIYVCVATNTWKRTALTTWT